MNKRKARETEEEEKKEDNDPKDIFHGYTVAHLRTVVNLHRAQTVRGLTQLRRSELIDRIKLLLLDNSVTDEQLQNQLYAIRNEHNSQVQARKKRKISYPKEGEAPTLTSRLIKWCEDYSIGDTEYEYKDEKGAVGLLERFLTACDTVQHMFAPLFWLRSNTTFQFLDFVLGNRDLQIFSHKTPKYGLCAPVPLPTLSEDLINRSYAYFSRTDNRPVLNTAQRMVLFLPALLYHFIPLPRLFAVSRFRTEEHFIRTYASVLKRKQSSTMLMDLLVLWQHAYEHRFSQAFESVPALCSCIGVQRIIAQYAVAPP